MFESKEEIPKAVDAVYALTVSLKRGDILRHGDIRKVLKIAPHTGCWEHVIAKVRSRIREDRGIECWQERTVGYKLLTVAEQLEVPRKRAKRAVRQIVKGRVSQEAFRDADLTDHQRTVRNRNMEFMTDAEQEMRRRLREHQALMKPSPVIPHRQIDES